MSFFRIFGSSSAANSAFASPTSAVPDAASAHLAAQKSFEDSIVSNPDMKQFGMENFGNTCYANSVLQALYFCQPFRDLVCATPDSFREEFPPPAPPPVSPVPTRTTATLPSAHSDQQSGLSSSVQPPLLASNTNQTPLPPTLFSALRALYLHISTHTSNKGVIAPSSFITKLKKENELFRGTAHQDAHEFLNYLLNKIVEDLQSDQYTRPTPPPAVTPINSDRLAGSVGSLTESSSTPNHSLTTAAPTNPNSKSSSNKSKRSNARSGLSANPTLVHTLFEGVLTNETRCLTCETVSSRDESFLDLSIDIEDNSSVTACLRQFSASEMLCQKNKFFCDSCCSLQEAEKRMKIKILPNVLALHLKRFKLLPAEDKYVKLAYRVAFPLELRLFNTVDDAEDPDRLYSLFAIVVHIGGGPHHGHYITIVRSFGSVWRVFDDVNVSTIQDTEIPKYFGDMAAGAGYVLFYQAADLGPESVGLPPKKVPVSGAVLGERTNLVPGGNGLEKDVVINTPTPSQPNGKPPSMVKAGKENPLVGIAPPIITSPPLPGSAPPIAYSSSVPTRSPLNASTSTLSNRSGSSASPKGRLTPTSAALTQSSSKPSVGGLSIPSDPHHNVHLGAPSPTSAIPITPSGSGGISMPNIQNIFSRQKKDRPSSRPLSSSVPHDDPLSSSPSFPPVVPVPSSAEKENGYHSGREGGKEKEREKEGGSRTSWFRPKRKESTSQAIPSGRLSEPNVGAVSTSPIVPSLSTAPPAEGSSPRAGTSFLPELRHSRSSIRPGPRISVAPDTFVPPPPSPTKASTSGSSSQGQGQALLRPRTAPGSSVPPSPSTPSPSTPSRSSLDRGYYTPVDNIPPVPPLPPIPSQSTVPSSSGSSTVVASSGTPSRRGSLSKPALGNVLHRNHKNTPEAMPAAIDPFPPSRKNLPDTPQARPPSPVATNFPAHFSAKLPRRVNSVLPISTPSSKSSTITHHQYSNAAEPSASHSEGFQQRHLLSQSTTGSRSRPENTYNYPMGPGANSAALPLHSSTTTPPSHLLPNGIKLASRRSLSRERDPPRVASDMSTLPPSPAAPTKRASRKMSLIGTGSFFSALRNHKDKDKDRNKEDDPSHSQHHAGSGNGNGNGNRLSKLQPLAAALLASPGPPPPPPKNTARSSGVNGSLPT